MSNGNTVLNCSKAFLDCLQANLAGIEGAKGDDVRYTYTRDTRFVRGLCAESTCSIKVIYS